MNSHVFFCVSNACVDAYTDNSLTEFTNNLPKDFNLKKRNHWEIGIAAFGIDLNLLHDSDLPGIIQIKSTVTDYNDIGELPVLYHTSIEKKYINSYFYKSTVGPLHTNTPTYEFFDLRTKIRGRFVLYIRTKFRLTYVLFT